MGNRWSAWQAAKRQVFIEAVLEQSLGSARLVRRKSLPRDGRLDAVAVPQLFTTFKSLSTEWNLCGKFDPTRRVNVVADTKLQRKKLKFHFVDKVARLRMNSEAVTLARNELEILCYLTQYCDQYLGYIHRNIVHLYGYYPFKRKVHVIVEFCELGSLMTALVRAPDPALQLVAAPSEDALCDIMHQLCNGLAFLHANGIAHCDVALDNIYATSANEIKLGDFDHAVFVGPENALQLLKTSEPARKVYGAPELFGCEGKRADLMKSDVWSLGIVFIMLLTKKPLFDAASADDKGFQLYTRVGLRAYMKAMYLEQSAMCKLSDEMVEFAEGMLTPDPRARLSVAQAIASSWFSVSRVAAMRLSTMERMQVVVAQTQQHVMSEAEPDSVARDTSLKSN